MTVSDKTFLAYASANVGLAFDKLNYIHAIFLNEELSSDLAFSLLDLISPSFKEVDGYLFLDFLFSGEIYREHISSGRKGKEIQVWMNLVGVSDVFEDMSIEDAILFANKISRNWNLIISELKLGKGSARVIVDDDKSVYVTVD